MSKKFVLSAVALGAALLTAMATETVAQEKIKIGVVTHLSGAYASPGSKYLHGIDAFFANYGHKVGGRDV